MELLSYLFYHDIQIQEFAEVLEIHRAYLSQIIHGKHRPSKKLSRQILMETGGLVKMRDDL